MDMGQGNFHDKLALFKVVEMAEKNLFQSLYQI